MTKVIMIRSRAIDAAVFKIADSLSMNGFDVHLLVWDRQHTIKKDENARYTVHKFNLKAPYDKLSVVLYHPFWQIYQTIFLIKNRADIIHACDLDTLLPAVLVSSITKTKLFYIIYDFYANNFSGNSIFIKLFKSGIAALEKMCIGLTDCLFLVDESRLEEVAGAKIKKIVYLYNSPPDMKLDVRAPETDDKELTLFYAGPIQKERGVEYFIKAMEGLDNIKMIIASSDKLSNLTVGINEENKKRIEYIGWVPYHEVLKKTIDSDVLFRFEAPVSARSRSASPNKLFEAMMCGKPIIVNSEIGASRIVQDEKCGYAVTYGDVDAIRHIYTGLRDNPQLRADLGRNGRKAYEQKYSWVIMEKKLLDTYRN